MDIAEQAHWCTHKGAKDKSTQLALIRAACAMLPHATYYISPYVHSNPYPTTRFRVSELLYDPHLATLTSHCWWISYSTNMYRLNDLRLLMVLGPCCPTARA